MDSLQLIFKINSLGYWNGINNLGYSYVDLNADGLDDIFYPIMTANTEVPMRPFIFINNGSSFALNDNIVPTDYKGGTDMRKSIVCDFNNDSLPDIFLNNTANEQSPNRPQNVYQYVMLSVKGNKSVSYKIGDVPSQLYSKGGYHGVAAGDLNNDKNADVVLVGQNMPKVLYGKGDGTFEYGLLNVPNYHSGFITTEIVDIDGDGKNDIILCGAESNDYSKILWGKFNLTTYSNITTSIYDKLKLVVDVNAEDIDGDGIKEIILVRTYDGLDGSPFYRGYYITIYKTIDNFISFKDITSDFIDAPLSTNNVTGGWITHLNIINDVDGKKIMVADVSGCYQYTDYRSRPYLKIWKQNSTTKRFETLYH